MRLSFISDLITFLRVETMAAATSILTPSHKTSSMSAMCNVLYRYDPLTESNNEFITHRDVRRLKPSPRHQDKRKGHPTNATQCSHGPSTRAICVETTHARSPPHPLTSTTRFPTVLTPHSAINPHPILRSIRHPFHGTTTSNPTNVTSNVAPLIINVVETSI